MCIKLGNKHVRKMYTPKGEKIAGKKKNIFIFKNFIIYIIYLIIVGLFNEGK
jgi:hypothetical protein